MCNFHYLKTTNDDEVMLCSCMQYIHVFKKKSEKVLFNSHKQVMICFCLNERYGIITVLLKHVNWLELPDAPYHQWTSCFSIIKYTI